jgi:hypothetical protein
MIYRLLEHLACLFQDAEKFRGRYGMRQIKIKMPKATATAAAVAEDAVALSSPRGGMSAKTATTNLRSRFKLFQRQTRFTAKLRWAIHDKKKFGVLLADLKELVEQLRDITKSVADLERQRQALKTEVLSVSDVHSLEVLEDATREDDPELSEVASQRITQLTDGSAAGTDLDGRIVSVSTYLTARTQVGSERLDARSEGDFEALRSVALLNAEEAELVERNEPADDEFDASDFTFSQRNYLKGVQEKNRENFNELRRRSQGSRIPQSGVSNQPQLRGTYPVKRILRELKMLCEDQVPLTSVGVEMDDMVCISPYATTVGFG